MTNEQAIDILNMVEAHGLADEAKKLAIKALQNDRPQGEYKTACNVLLSLEQIVRRSEGWEDSAVEAVHNAIQTAIKCMHERPQGEWIEVKPHQSDLEDGIDYREECSICHEPNRHYGFDEYHDIRFATYYKTNFCPNCGAKMQKGGTNE